MGTQMVMDHTGDSRHQFDPADPAAVAKAEVRSVRRVISGRERLQPSPKGPLPEPES